MFNPKLLFNRLCTIFHLGAPKPRPTQSAQPILRKPLFHLPAQTHSSPDAFAWLSEEPYLVLSWIWKTIMIAKTVSMRYDRSLPPSTKTVRKLADGNHYGLLWEHRWLSLAYWHIPSSCSVFSPDTSAQQIVLAQGTCPHGVRFSMSSKRAKHQSNHYSCPCAAPALEVVQYERKTFEAAFHQDSPYKGASPEVDAAWNNITRGDRAKNCGTTVQFANHIPSWWFLRPRRPTSQSPS